ncbi:hypothetical protein EWM64_g1394 [Hericium alpestre]|uniref:Uncharacterized protein n=1 Tax=Hericium alpestre TaxID=135208 RepID=A0A4Z0AAQ2_9AGAM|nr:hypothetical protein EWM64_g1394 [Hericium alpestre]
MHWTTSLESPRGPVIQLLFNSFDLQVVTHVMFNLESFDEDVCGALKRALTQMPAMRADVMTPESTASDTDHEQDTQPVPLSLPNLTSLTVSEAKFGDITLDHEGKETALGDLLLVVIQKQAMLNTPLHALSISHCEGAEPMLARLRPHVKELHYAEP